jgi:hypothetical protein
VSALLELILLVLVDEDLVGGGHGCTYGVRQGYRNGHVDEGDGVTLVVVVMMEMGLGWVVRTSRAKRGE